MQILISDQKETITLPNKADFEKLLKDKKGWYCPVKIRVYAGHRNRKVNNGVCITN